MSKIRWMVFIIVIGLMSSAFAGSIYLPLRFAEEWGNDPPNSVTATIFKNVTDSVDQVALTRHTNAPGLGIWYDSVQITTPGIFTVNYVAVWTSGNDTARAQQIIVMIDAALTVSDSNVARDVTKIDYQSTTGPGAVNVRILALDTANSVSVEDADITMKLPDGTKKHVVQTQADGWASMTMNEVTYEVYAQHGQYVFSTPACTLTVLADSLRDTIRCYPYDPGTPGAPNLCRVSGVIYDAAGDPMRDVRVTLNIDREDFGDSILVDTSLTPNVIVVDYAGDTLTDSLGQWSLDRIPSALFNLWGVQYLYEATKHGIVVPGHSRKVTVPNQANARIEDLF